MYKILFIQQIEPCVLVVFNLVCSGIFLESGENYDTCPREKLIAHICYI